MSSSPSARAADGTGTAPEPALSALREQIAKALYESLDRPRLHPWDGLSPLRRHVHYRRADAVLEVILPTTKLLGELARSADADVKRVITLYEQWVKAGPPPLGTSVSRWWDARLVELREAILPPEPVTDPS